MTPDREMVAKLATVFGVEAWKVSVERDADAIVVTLEGDEETGPAFTFAQMAQLPAILGTEHIDFGNESGHARGSSWTGDYGHYNNLVITARLARSTTAAVGTAGSDADEG